MSEINTAIRTIDLRCRIADHYDFFDQFHERIARSASSSLAAIYFHRDELDAIARDLGIDPDAHNKDDLLVAIRDAAGCNRTSGHGLDWLALKNVVETLEISVADDCYYDVSTDDTVGEVDTQTDAQPDGIWTDWAGGADD